MSHHDTEHEHKQSSKDHAAHAPHEDSPTKGPSSPDEINPKVSSDIAFWSKEFGVTGDALHEALRVHGHKVAKVRAALAAHHHADNAPHEKQGR